MAEFFDELSPLAVFDIEVVYVLNLLSVTRIREKTKNICVYIDKK